MWKKSLQFLNVSSYGQCRSSVGSFASAPVVSIPPRAQDSHAARSNEKNLLPLCAPVAGLARANGVKDTDGVVVRGTGDNEDGSHFAGQLGCHH